MIFPRARLIVSALLFVAWLGFLLFLVIDSRDTIVLSRPQLLASNLLVVAELQDENGSPEKWASIRRVVWSADRADEHLADEKVLVPNLIELSGHQGYRGSGVYILPLTKRLIQKQPLFLVTPVPSIPGYVPAAGRVELLDPGEHPEAVIAAIADFADITNSEAADLVAKKHALIQKNTPGLQAYHFRDRVEKLGGKVQYTPTDTRVYPLTPQTSQQLDAIAATR